MMETVGYDHKMASHSLRLLDQIEQILTVGDLDLMRNKEEVKSMKYGNWGDFEKFETYVYKRLNQLEELSIKTKLAQHPPKESMKVLLAECIEEWYGSELGMQKQTNEYVSVQQLWNRIDKFEEVFLKTCGGCKNLLK